MIDDDLSDPALRALVEKLVADPRCHWVDQGDGIQFFVPHCMGGALDGPKACTCRDVTPPLYERLQRERMHRRAMEERYDRMCERLRASHTYTTSLQRRLREALAELDKLKQ